MTPDEIATRIRAHPAMDLAALATALTHITGTDAVDLVDLRRVSALLRDRAG